MYRLWNLSIFSAKAKNKKNRYIPGSNFSAS